MNISIIQIAFPYPNLSGNNANRNGNGRVYKKDDAKAYELAIKSVVVNSRFASIKIDHPISVVFDAWPPDKRERDSDNVEKPLKDAITRSGLWATDSNKLIIESTFRWHERNAEEAPQGMVLVTIKKHTKESQ